MWSMSIKVATDEMVFDMFIVLTNGFDGLDHCNDWSRMKVAVIK